MPINGNRGLKGRIVVRSPYRAQVEVTRDTLDPDKVKNMGLIVDTVDYMQGAEKDIVTLSCTKSNDHGSVGFVANTEHLNVVLSRAKTPLFIIGDDERLFQVPAFKRFIEW